MYKLLAIDLDETLLTRDKRITDENKKWIRRAMENGVVVVIATGRGYPNMKQFREELGLKTPMVLSNGSEVWDQEAQIIKKDLIKEKDIHFLTELVNAYNVDFWANSGHTFVRKENWKHHMVNDRWTQFVIWGDKDKTTEEIRQQVIGIDSLEVTQSSRRNIEFTYKDVSKASGVKTLCEYLNIHMENVMAIGDNFNDLQLIQQAGLGIAMGNAEEVVKKAADDITDTNEENGVAVAIRRYLF